MQREKIILTEAIILNDKNNYFQENEKSNK